MNDKLPAGWGKCFFGDVIYSISNGITGKQNKEGEGFPVTRIETIASGEIDLKKIGYVNSFPIEKIKQYRLKIGDILFSHINSDIHLGKTALYKNVNFDLYHGCNLLRIQSDRSLITPEFLEYLCRLLRMNGTFQLNAQHAVNQSSLNQKKIKNISIPVAPLPEQKRIAAKLDKLTTSMDNCKARLDRVSEIRNQLLMKFVDYSSSKSKTLEKYIEECNDRIGTEWERRPRIGVSNSEGIIPLRTGKKTTFENYKIVEPGDFIYNTMRVNIGSIALYRDKEVGITSPDYVVFRTNENLSSEFLLLFLKSKYGIQEINKNTKGSVRSRLYFKSLSNVEIPISNDYSQKSIEAILISFETCVKKLKAVKHILDDLYSSILSKAFKGELVPQDLCDEPVEKLLKRIRIERKSLDLKKNEIGRTENKKFGRKKKTKSTKVKAPEEPEPATIPKSISTKKTASNVKPKNGPVPKFEKRFDKLDVLKAYRKAIFRQIGIDELTLLRLTGQRLGVKRLSQQIREELESYLKTGVRRKILYHDGDGYSAGAPTIEYYEDDFLIKVLKSVAKKGWEYPREYLVDEAASYLGFDKASEAFRERMKSVFRKAVRRNALYRNGVYVGKV